MLRQKGIAVTLVVGYDEHPASRAALVFAGELAGALNVPLHVVHVVDDGGDAATTSAGPAGSGGSEADVELHHIRDALGGTNPRWSYHRLRGDPAAVLLEATGQQGASMLIVGRPQQGIGATVGHLITGNVARNILRHSTRPVVVVPEFGAVTQ
jgi:nucleotide-binding universal stress UspA family protein